MSHFFECSVQTKGCPSYCWSGQEQYLKRLEPHYTAETKGMREGAPTASA